MKSRSIGFGQTYKDQDARGQASNGGGGNGKGRGKMVSLPSRVGNEVIGDTII